MKIGLICGGFGDEREISLKSSKSMMKSLKENGHDVHCLDPLLFDKGIKDDNLFDSEDQINRDQNMAEAYWRCFSSFKEFGVEVVFNGLHGGEGEDGRIQALFELFDLPYTGSGPRASAVGMDKDMSKILFRQVGGNTADWILLKSDRNYDVDEIKKLDLPLVVKGNHQGSSVGLTIIDSWHDLKAAISRALSCDSMVIIERYIKGRELTVGVLEGEAFPIVEIAPKKGVYDYHAKYTEGASDYYAPANLERDVAVEVTRQALLAWDVLKLENYARIDFRLDEKNTPFFLEANTLPGMTELSLIPMGAKAAGIDFVTLLEKIMAGAIQRHQKELKI